MPNHVHATGLSSRQFKVGMSPETLCNAIHHQPLCQGPALRKVHP